MLALTLDAYDPLPWVLWGLKVSLVFAAAVGAVAVFCPRLFARIATFGATWIDTSAAFERIDRPVLVDKHFVSHSRAFGAVVLGGAAVWVYVTPASASWAWMAWCGSGLVGLVGLLAVLRPTWFERLVHYSSQWVDTSRFLKPLDRRIDIDTAVLGQCRAFGGLVLTTVAAVTTLVFFP